MTVYEQIQKSIDAIENDLNDRITSEFAAYHANMSQRSFYNYFWSLTGYSFGEYLRKRRLSEALSLLLNRDESILNIALEVGYESHEAFSRAFNSEFGLSPSRFRKRRQSLNGLKKITLIKEMYMGVVIRDLPDTKVVSFTGFSPEPEDKANERIIRWAKENGYGNLFESKVEKPYRIFGYNTDEKGERASENTDMENYGYKVMMTISEDTDKIENDLTVETIKPGKFAVTGIEGDIEKAWEFIPEGWQKLLNMIKQKGYRIKEGGRCFEERLEPSTPGLLRFDLYLEIDDIN